MGQEVMGSSGTIRSREEPIIPVTNRILRSIGPFSLWEKGREKVENGRREEYWKGNRDHSLAPSPSHFLLKIENGKEISGGSEKGKYWIRHKSLSSSLFLSLGGKEKREERSVPGLGGEARQAGLDLLFPLLIEHRSKEEGKSKGKVYRSTDR